MARECDPLRDEPETLECGIVRLRQLIADLRDAPQCEERQKAVCLGTRSVDAIFQIDALFAESIDLNEYERVEKLIGEAMSVLPSGSSYWESVSLRLEQLFRFYDRMKCGILLEQTTTFTSVR